MKPRVLLDVDGVLADFVGGYLKLLQEHTGLVRTHADVTEFDIGASLSLSPEQASRMKRAVSDAPQFARTLAVYPGAQAGVTELQRVADVYIVTSPWNSNPTWCHDREWWLYENFHIPYARVIHASAKYIVRGDVLVDDKVSTVEDWRREHPTSMGVIWDTPHNRLDASDAMRTSSWGYLCDQVAAFGSAVLR